MLKFSWRYRKLESLPEFPPPPAKRTVGVSWVHGRALVRLRGARGRLANLKKEYSERQEAKGGRALAMYTRLRS